MTRKTGMTYEETMAAKLGRMTRAVLQFATFMFLTVKLSDFNGTRFYMNNNFEVICVVIISTAQAFFYTRNVFMLVSWLYNNWADLLDGFNGIWNSLIYGIDPERKDDLKRR